MTDAIAAIVFMSAPLLLATLGALVTERAGVLAVFMDGAITLSGFVCVAVTGATGSPAAGFCAAALSTVLLLLLVALFNEATGANPFITGLAVNLLASGLTSWMSVVIFRTRGVVALPQAIPGAGVGLATLFAFASALILAFVFHWTPFGLNLRITGSDPAVLSARGIDPARYRVVSWCIAAFFASCAGTALSLGLGAWVPNLSAGRGWTALAACYLGYRNPLLCVASVLLFSGAEYLSNVMQGLANIPSTVILGFPYLLALLAFICIPATKR